MSAREEFGAFVFESYASIGGDGSEAKVGQFNAWVNQRLAAGGRIKSVTQCAGGAERLVATTITVVIEYPERTA